MKSKYLNKSGTLIDNNGNLYKVVNEEDPKYFGVVTMCGHCGNGYFIPILFPIRAKDMDSAIEIARNLPRVKYNAKNCILEAMELDKKEFDFIQYVNDHDPYLTDDQPHHFFDEQRKIITPDILENLESYKKTREFLNKHYEIKCAEQYTKNWVLQRYFAPQKYGDKIVFPKSINKKQMLIDYIEQYVWYYGIKNPKCHVDSGKLTTYPLKTYLELFGLDNNLKIGLLQSKTDPSLYYFTYQGEKINRTLEDKTYYATTNYIDQIKNTPHKYEANETDAIPFDDNKNFDPKEKAKSGLERFYSKWGKNFGKNKKDGRDGK
ncbi:MAG: hypothetical protein ACI4R8_03530 [Candidatus Caccovivens sp.]